jgi:hypothetical protein
MNRQELISKIIRKTDYSFSNLINKSKVQLQELFEKVKKQPTKKVEAPKPKPKPLKREIRNTIYNKAKDLGLKIKYTTNIDKLKNVVKKEIDYIENYENNLAKAEDYNNNLDEIIKKIEDNRKEMGKSKRLIIEIDGRFATINQKNYRETMNFLKRNKENSFLAIKDRDGSYTYKNKDGNYIIVDKDGNKRLDLDRLYDQKGTIQGFEAAVMRSFSGRDDSVSDPESASETTGPTDIQLSLVGMSSSSSGFFPYVNKTEVDLSHCGIFNSVDKNNYKISCFHLALKNSGLFKEKEINDIKNIIVNDYFPKSKLGIVAKKLGVTIRLAFRKKTGRKDIRYQLYNKGQKILNIGTIENHYFINNNGEFAIIEKMLKQNKFTPIATNDLELFDTIFVDDIYNRSDNINLEYSNKSYQIAISDQDHKMKQDDKELYDNIIYADFESITEGTVHKSYMCALVDKNNNKKVFIGENNAQKFLDYLSKIKGQILVYFHNLGYDYQFFVKECTILGIIKNGSSVKQLSILFKGKHITFRDSFCLIPNKLDYFQKMFGIKSKKGFLPHHLFTNKNIYDYNGFVTLSSIIDEIPKEHHNQIKRYEMNGEINLIDYAQDYCLDDCITLKEGVEKYKSEILLLLKNNGKSDITNMNTINSAISTPSLVFKIMQSNSKNLQGIYKFSNNIQKYLQKFMVGGRVMMQNNKKQFINDGNKIASLDANSLYPAAFLRIGQIGGFLKGLPKILNNNDKNIDFLNSVDGYFIRIKIIKVNDKKPFPILSIKKKSGIRHFSNNVEGQIISVDKFTLEDAIVHHNIEFEIIDGYYFNEGRNPEMCDLVNDLYNTRLSLKSKGNPLENVYKLLLNSLYGKFGENIKNKETEIKIVNQDGYEKFIDKNYHRIKDFYMIGKDYKDKNIYLFNTRKVVNDHYNFLHICNEILSMSKRIMNEVFEVAHNNNIEIFYQDTDSMKLYQKDVQKLSDAFRIKYNKDLIGKSLGQFKDEYADLHSDIFIAVGKKFYFSNDKLKKNDYKISSKGIPKELLLKNLDENNQIINPEKLFTDLYNNKKITFTNKNFDKCMFKHNKDLSISNNYSFNRTVQFIS